MLVTMMVLKVMKIGEKNLLLSSLMMIVLIMFVMANQLHFLSVYCFLHITNE